jgi:hypothetical protein
MGSCLLRPEWLVGMGMLSPIVRLDNLLYNDAAFMQPFCVAKTRKIAIVAVFLFPLALDASHGADHERRMHGHSLPPNGFR